jgi:hypothetical protein
VAKLEQVAPSAENQFFDNPVKKNVLEFALSQAISNNPEVATNALVEADSTDKSFRQTEKEVLEAPPTPDEIIDQEGGQELSSLNQFIISTSEDIDDVPTCFEEAPKAQPVETSMRKEAVRKALRRLGYVIR